MRDSRRAVLLHGIASDAATWRRVQGDLRDRGWDVTAVHLPGHCGRPADGAVTVDDLARSVAGDLGVRQFPSSGNSGGVDLLIGHSLGAIVALTLAVMVPEAARAVVLEDPPGLAGIDALKVADGLQASVAAARKDQHDAARGLQRANPAWSPVDAAATAQAHAVLDLDAALTLLREHADWDLPGLVDACPVPVYLIAAEGPDSGLVDPDRAALLRRLPAGRVRVIVSGHSVHLDDPVGWLEAVLAFSKAVPPAS